MTRPSRRGVLGGLAVLAVPIVPAVAVATVSPDAELIRGCARYLELERIMSDPAHPERDRNCDDMREWPEYAALEAMIAASEPKTPQGWAAIASAALLCDAAIEGAPWDDGEETRIAWKVLAHVAGPAVVAEEERRAAERNRRVEANLARLNAEIVTREAEDARREAAPPSREERMAELRSGLRFVEPRVAAMRAELAALEAVS